MWFIEGGFVRGTLSAKRFTSKGYGFRKFFLRHGKLKEDLQVSKSGNDMHIWCDDMMWCGPHALENLVFKLWIIQLRAEGKRERERVSFAECELFCLLCFQYIKTISIASPTLSHGERVTFRLAMPVDWIKSFILIEQSVSYLIRISCVP